MVAPGVDGETVVDRVPLVRVGDPTFGLRAGEPLALELAAPCDDEADGVVDEVSDVDDATLRGGDECVDEQPTSTIRQTVRLARTE